MSLTPGLKTALDLLGKLQRDAELLNQGVSSDRFFNFVITGYSLIDWIKHDKSVPERARAPDAIQTLHAEPWLKVCGDLASRCRETTVRG